MKKRTDKERMDLLERCRISHFNAGAFHVEERYAPWRNAVGITLREATDILLDVMTADRARRKDK